MGLFVAFVDSLGLLPLVDQLAELLTDIHYCFLPAFHFVALVSTYFTPSLPFIAQSGQIFYKQVKQ